MSLIQLALTFLKIGALGFGGPFSLLAIVQKEVVERRREVYCGGRAPTTGSDGCFGKPVSAGRQRLEPDPSTGSPSPNINSFQNGPSHSPAALGRQ